jgi:hypothetical protein
MRTLGDLLGDLKKKETAMRKLQEATPTIIGTIAVKAIKDNFKAQGYNGGNELQVWAKRKEVTNKNYDYNRTKKYRTPKRGKVSTHKNALKGSVYQSDRPILVQTGNLRDSIMFKTSGNKVFIGVLSNVKKPGATQEAHAYAKHLNEGGVGKWGKYATTHTVARKFMPRPDEGPNSKMLAMIKKKQQFELDKIFREWQRK